MIGKGWLVEIVFDEDEDDGPAHVECFHFWQEKAAALFQKANGGTMYRVFRNDEYAAQNPQCSALRPKEGS